MPRLALGTLWGVILSYRFHLQGLQSCSSLKLFFEKFVNFGLRRRRFGPILAKCMGLDWPWTLSGPMHGTMERWTDGRTQSFQQESHSSMTAMFVLHVFS